MPLLAIAARQGQVATNPERTAVIVVGTRSRWLSLAATILIGIAVWMTGTSAAALALVSVSPSRQVAYIVLDAWLLLQIAILLPPGLHIVAMALQSAGSGAHRIGRLAAEHRAHGHECYVVGPWAAWPPGPGLDLADTALQSLPAHARLIAAGRDDRVCAYLRRKGFTTIEARTMIR